MHQPSFFSSNHALSLSDRNGLMRALIRTSFFDKFLFFKLDEIGGSDGYVS